MFSFAEPSQYVPYKAVDGIGKTNLSSFDFSCPSLLTKQVEFLKRDIFFIGSLLCETPEKSINKIDNNNMQVVFIINNFN